MTALCDNSNASSNQPCHLIPGLNSVSQPLVFGVLVLEKVNRVPSVQLAHFDVVFDHVRLDPTGSTYRVYVIMRGKKIPFYNDSQVI